MKRRDFIKSVAALSATAALPLAVLPLAALPLAAPTAPTAPAAPAAPAAATWQMVLYNGDTVIAKCEGTVQSSPDTFDGEFVFKDAAVIERVYLQHESRKTTTHGITFPSIYVAKGDVLRMHYKLERP